MAASGAGEDPVVEGKSAAVEEESAAVEREIPDDMLKNIADYLEPYFPMNSNILYLNESQRVIKTVQEIPEEFKLSEEDEGEDGGDAVAGEDGSAAGGGGDGGKRKRRYAIRITRKRKSLRK